MKQPFSVLVTDRFDVEAMATLRGNPDLKVATSDTPKPTAEELAGVRGLIIRSRTRIDREFLSRCSDLEVIVTATSGFDHIDLEATHEKSITAMFTPEANAASAAELTWALTLATARRIPEAHRSVKSGDWRREALVGRELSGQTYGVIGLGRIGARVARVASAFGMKILAFDPYKDDAHFEKHSASRVSLEELFRMADVISCHVPATLETDRMLTRAYLEPAEKGLIFINTSRGTVVEETLLIEALEQGWIAACGLDVFEREPLSRQSKLNTLPNVVLSPHLGATTGEAFRAASMEAAQKISVFASSGASSDRLPPEEEWYSASFRKQSGSGVD